MFGLFKKEKAFQNMGSQEFAAKLKEAPDAVLLDVRTSSEFRSGYIPGAINIDLMRHDFNERINALDPHKSYFVYCRSGGRSAQVCSVLSSRGLKAFNLSGGIGAWRGEISTR